jgi:hypothetical protein
MLKIHALPATINVPPSIIMIFPHSIDAAADAPDMKSLRRAEMDGKVAELRRILTPDGPGVAQERAP